MAGNGSEHTNERQEQEMDSVIEFDRARGRGRGRGWHRHMLEEPIPLRRPHSQNCNFLPGSLPEHSGSMRIMEQESSVPTNNPNVYMEQEFGSMQSRGRGHLANLVVPITTNSSLSGPGMRISRLIGRDPSHINEHKHLLETKKPVCVVQPMPRLPPPSDS